MKFGAVALCILTVISTTQASMISLSAEARGWIRENGTITNNAGSTNYVAGYYGDGDHPDNLEYRSYLLFQIPELQDSESVSSARLSLVLPENGYDSEHSSEVYQLFDIQSSLENLTNLPGLSNEIRTLIFDDLGSGKDYGSVEIQSTENSTLVDIWLTGQAIEDILSHQGGLFGIGGAVSTLISEPGTIEFVFARTQETALSQSQLILEVVPEPSTLSILLVGGVILPLRRRRIRVTNHFRL